MPRTIGPPYDRFLATAEDVIRDRHDVDADMVREIFREVATLLDDGLALDGLDSHDTDAAVDALCLDLVAPDPGAAIRARATATRAAPDDLHDPDAVRAALLIAAAILQL